MNSQETFRELLCETDGGVLTVDGESKHWNKLYTVGLAGYSIKRVMGRLVTGTPPEKGKGEVFYITNKAFNRWCVNRRGTKPELRREWDCAVLGISDGSNPDNRLGFKVSDFLFYEKKGAVFTRLSLGKYRLFGDFVDFKDGKPFVGFGRDGEPLCFMPSYGWMEREYEHIAFVSEVSELESYAEDCKRLIFHHLSLLDDKEYQLEAARSRLTGSDCSIKAVGADGVSVTEFESENNGVCKLLNDVDRLQIYGYDWLEGVQIVDASVCKDLRSIGIELVQPVGLTFIAPSESNGLQKLSLKHCNVVGLSKVLFRYVGDFNFFSLDINECTGLDRLSVEAVGYSEHDDRNAVKIDDKTLTELSVNAPILRLSARSFCLETPHLQSLSVVADEVRVGELPAMFLDTPEVKSLSLKVRKIGVAAEEKGSGAIWLNFDAFKSLRHLNLEVTEPCEAGLRLVLPEGCSATARGVVCLVYKKVGEIGG